VFVATVPHTGLAVDEAVRSTVLEAEPVSYLTKLIPTRGEPVPIRILIRKVPVYPTGFCASQDVVGAKISANISLA
jgi:hypothetical protein